MVSATPPVGTGSGFQSSNNIAGTQAVKVADPDIVLVDQQTLPVELLAKMIFEEIGGQQLLAISRHDIVNGQQVIYNPIANIPQIAFAYNSGNIIPIQDPNKEIFAKFLIDFAKKIPSFREVISNGIVSFDSNNENIEILVQNISPTEEVEVQVLSSGQAFNDTIYEESES